MKAKRKINKTIKKRIIMKKLKRIIEKIKSRKSRKMREKNQIKEEKLLRKMMIRRIKK
jgi:hypothetical protein